MKEELSHLVHNLHQHWSVQDDDSCAKIRTLVEGLAKNVRVIKFLEESEEKLWEGREIHRDEKTGFILLAYAEKEGTYRRPHNHGAAWVVYAVVSGEVEMGNYLNSGSFRGPHLVLKEREKMIAGDGRFYHPGDIHETRCLSEKALILRLTSCDLKEEERAGRMLRFSESRR